MRPTIHLCSAAILLCSFASEVPIANAQSKLSTLRKAFQQELKEELKKQAKEKAIKEGVEKIFDNNETLNLITDYALTCNPPLNPQCIFLALTQSTPLGDPNKEAEKIRRWVAGSDKFLSAVIPLWKKKKLELLADLKKWQEEQQQKQQQFKQQEDDLQTDISKYNKFARTESATIKQLKSDLQQRVTRFNDWLSREQEQITKTAENLRNKAKEPTDTINHYLRHFKQASESRSGAKRNSAVRHHNHLAKTGELLEEIPSYLVGSIRNIWVAKIARPHNAQFRQVKKMKEDLDRRVSQYKSKASADRGAIERDKQIIDRKIENLKNRKSKIDEKATAFKKEVERFIEDSKKQFKQRFEERMKIVKGGESLITMAIQNLAELSNRSIVATEAKSKWQYKMRVVRDEIRKVEQAKN